MDTKVFNRTTSRIRSHFSMPIHTDSLPVDMANFQADPALAFLFKLSNELKLNIFERATYHDEGIRVKSSTSGPDHLDGFFSPIGIKLARTCKELQPLAMAAFLKVNVFHFSLDTKWGHGLVDDLAAVLYWLRRLGPLAKDVRNIYAKSQRLYTPESLTRYLSKSDNGLHLGRVVEEILELTKANICLVFDGVLIDLSSYEDPTVTIDMSRSQELEVAVIDQKSDPLSSWADLVANGFVLVSVEQAAHQREMAEVKASVMQACRVAFEEKLWDDETLGSEGLEDDDDGEDDDSGDEEMGDAEPADEEMHDSESREEEDEGQDEGQDGDEEGEGDDGGEQDSEDEEDQEEEEADNEEGDNEEDKDGEDEEEGEEQDDEDDGDDDE